VVEDFDVVVRIVFGEVELAVLVLPALVVGGVVGLDVDGVLDLGGGAHALLLDLGLLAEVLADQLLGQFVVHTLVFV